MSLRQIDDIDIISQAGAVFGRIIVSKDAQALTLTDGCLGDERNEVVRNPTRKLSDKG